MSTEPASHDVVVIGASAGGVEALVSLVHALPSDLDAAVFVVLHVAPEGTSVLADILRRAGPLPAEQARQDDQVRPGRILVAPPDHHLRVARQGVLLDHGPRETGHRPAVDALFRSAAAAYGPRVIGVVLSGSRDDGASGLAAIKAAGGIAMAQSPQDALYPSMPQAAIDQVQMDAVGSCQELAALIGAAVGSSSSALSSAVAQLDREGAG